MLMDLSWVYKSWLGENPHPWVYPIIALAAIVCGLLIGGERQRREKPAGLRTLALVCLGAAVFTMCSFAFTTTTGDSGRVAAQIVTGIGFLGAGVILHNRRVVSGVTTAAIIWVTAAIGMAVGAGFVLAGIFLSLLVNRLMVVIFLYETKWHPDLTEVRITLDYIPTQGLTRTRLERILSDYELVGANVEWNEASTDKGQMVLHVRLARVHFYELLAELVDVPNVTGISRERKEKLKPVPTK